MMLGKSLLAALATILWTEAAFGVVPPPEKCDSARIKAWKVFVSCENVALAKEAKSFYVYVDTWKAFWKCRHAYFKNWAKFQSDASLAGSACIGSRFTDNGDQTVTDNLTLLVWEKKSALDSVQNLVDPHDADNVYSLSAGAPYRETGTAYTDFVPSLNGGAGSAGSNGWRMPTLIELQTTMVDHACVGPGGGAACTCTGPCIDPALDNINTKSSVYWTANSHVRSPNVAWWINLSAGYVSYTAKTNNYYVRAVRGGL